MTQTTEWKADCLGEVTTISEAALLWGKSRTTIRHHVMTGRVQSRQTVAQRGELLIVMKDLITLYGQPTNIEAVEAIRRGMQQ